MIKKNDRPVFMARLRDRFPEPKSELQFKTPFELLVAVMLSAQATDKGVNLATAKLFPVANTPQAILDLGVEGLLPYVKTLNLFRTKAKHVVEAAAILQEKYGGEVPRDFKALVALPGVGRKNRQRRSQRRLRRADHCGRHAHLPRLQPHGLCQRQDPRRG